MRTIVGAWRRLLGRCMSGIGTPIALSSRLFSRWMFYECGSCASGPVPHPWSFLSQFTCSSKWGWEMYFEMGIFCNISMNGDEEGKRYISQVESSNI